MKIKIEMDEQAEEEVIIRCRGMTEQIAAIQRAVSEAAGGSPEDRPLQRKYRVLSSDE